MLFTVLQGMHYYYPQRTSEETEEDRGEMVTLRSPKWQAARMGLNIAPRPRLLTSAVCSPPTGRRNKKTKATTQ
jgi:hypothetical protein